MATTQIVEYTYTDPRTGKLIREREVREFPADRPKAVVEFKGRERGLVGLDDELRTRSVEDDRRGVAVRTRSRDRGEYGRRGLREYNRDRRIVRRRSSSSSSASAERDGQRTRNSDNRIRRHRSMRDRRERHQQPAEDGNMSDGGYLWYSMKKRKDANFFERNFDSSYDGLISAATGAAMGFVTAQRFANEENRGYKTVGAALAGAVTFNAAENWYRVFTEEREEAREEEEEEKEEREDRRKR